MEAKDHEFFADELVKFNAALNALKVLVDSLPAFKSQLIQFDNDYKSKSLALKKLQADLDGVEKQIRERSLLMDKNTEAARSYLNKKEVELRQLEEKLSYKEQQIHQNQKKVDALLVAANEQVERKSKSRVGV